MAGYPCSLSSGLLIALSLLHFVAVIQSNGVLELTQANFDSEIRGPKHLVVEFYAPWCQHCKETLPKFEQAASQLKNVLPHVTLAKIDCAANQALCKQYGVNFIPNIKHFYQGKVQDEMSAEKTLDNIVAFAKTSYQNAVQSLQ